MTRLLLLVSSALLAAAPGKLTINNQTVALTHVYARQAPNTFDAKKTSYYVLAVDRELTPAQRLDEDTLRDLTWQGQLHCVELELSGEGISWVIRSKHSPASMSGSQSPDPYKLSTANGRITGNVKMEKPSKLGDTEYYFEFAVDAPIEVKPVRPAPTAADKASAQNLASTKAYKTYLAALMKGDKAGLMQSVDPGKAKMIDTPEFPEMLKFIQSMQPKNITVVRGTESGGEAELELTGTGLNGIETGTVKMKQHDGRWVILRESWKQK